MESTVGASHEFSGRDQVDLLHWVLEAEEWLNPFFVGHVPQFSDSFLGVKPRQRKTAGPRFCQVSFLLCHNMHAQLYR